MASTKTRKQKTRRSAAKRFKVTGTGKIMFSRAGVRHLNTGSSRKQNRQLKGMGVMKKCDQPKAHKLLPYGGTL